VRIEEVLQNQRLNEWGQMVQAYRNSRKSVSAWCSENDINEKTYYYRQRKVCSALPANCETRPSGNQIAFAEVPLVWNGTALKSAITVRMRSAEIDIPNGADPRMVEIVLYLDTWGSHAERLHTGGTYICGLRVYGSEEGNRRICASGERRILTGSVQSKPVSFLRETK